jgi:hypothetical protein
MRGKQTCGGLAGCLMACTGPFSSPAPFFFSFSLFFFILYGFMLLFLH